MSKRAQTKPSRAKAPDPNWRSLLDEKGRFYLRDHQAKRHEVLDAERRDAILQFGTLALQVTEGLAQLLGMAAQVRRAFNMPDNYLRNLIDTMGLDPEAFEKFGSEGEGRYYIQFKPEEKPPGDSGGKEPAPGKKEKATKTEAPEPAGDGKGAEGDA